MAIELTEVEAPTTFRKGKETPYDFIADKLAEQIDGKAFNFRPDPEAKMTPDQIIGRIRRLAGKRYTPKAKIEGNGTITIQAVTKQVRTRKATTATVAKATPAKADGPKATPTKADGPKATPAKAGSKTASK